MVTYQELILSLMQEQLINWRKNNLEQMELIFNTKLVQYIIYQKKQLFMYQFNSNYDVSFVVKIANPANDSVVPFRPDVKLDHWSYV